MENLEPISDHVVVDTSTQRVSRSCVLGGISLGNYAVAIDSGDSIEVGASSLTHIMIIGMVEKHLLIVLFL